MNDFLQCIVASLWSFLHAFGNVRGVRIIYDDRFKKLIINVCGGTYLIFTPNETKSFVDDQANNVSSEENAVVSLS